MFAPALAMAETYEAKTKVEAILRQAPGQQYGELGRVSAGTPLSVTVCFDRGTFCAVKFTGGDGYLSGDLLTVVGTDRTVRDAEQERWAAIDKRRAAGTLPDWESRNIVVWGDSLSTNTFGGDLENLLLGRDVSMQGVPGEDGKSIAKRMLADTRYGKRLKVIWDRHYSNETIEAYMADIAPMVDKAAASGNFIVVSDIADLDGDTTYNYTAQADAATTEAINTALKAKYPDNYLDMTVALADPKLRSDGLHLTPAGYREVAKRLAAFIEAQGW